MNYGKSVRREVPEGEFEKLLAQLQPSEQLFLVSRAMFEELWNHRLTDAQTRAAALKAKLGNIQRQIEQFLDRIADTSVGSVIAAYEGRIRKLESQKLEINEKLAVVGRPVRSFDDSFRTAFEFPANPRRLWDSGQFEDRRVLLKLAFTD